MIFTIILQHRLYIQVCSLIAHIQQKAILKMHKHCTLQRQKNHQFKGTVNKKTYLRCLPSARIWNVILVLILHVIAVDGVINELFRSLYYY